MSSNPELHRCPLCPKGYKRREHLQRHWSSHGSARPYRCQSCGGAFQRHDVLKRHARTCDPKTKGVSTGKRRACDLCVRQKKACSAGQPCENCERQSATCNYSFLRDAEANTNSEQQQSHAAVRSSLTPAHGGKILPSVDSSTMIGPGPAAFESIGAVMFGDTADMSFSDSAMASTSWLDFLNLMPDEPMVSVPERDGALSPENPDTRSYSFMFLDNFTSRTGLIESFDCLTPDLREQIMSSFLQKQAEHGAVPASASISSRGSTSDTVPTPDVNAMGSSEPTPMPLSLAQYPWLHDPLMIKLQQIILLAKEVITYKPRNSAVMVEWSPLLEQRAIEFFSPARVRKFLEIFWSVWHPNVNFLHRPTFDPTSCKTILLAAMAVMGASISPDSRDQEDAKVWYNCVEEMAFTDDDLCCEPLYTWDTGVLIPAGHKRKVQALQAAYIVCLYQNWGGTDESKRRIRRYRFSTVVSAARDIGLSTARHQDWARGGFLFEWQDFILKEQLIRIIIWIFLLDNAFVIFNNLPPRMVIKEVQSALAWPESVFQAGTAEECLEEIRAWSARAPLLSNMTVRQVIELVCSDGIGEDMHHTLADMGPLNLFMVVSVTHILIFQHQNLFSGNSQLIAIRHALKNWRAIWEIYSSKLASTPPHSMIGRDMITPENAWRRIGFMRYSPEYWLLAIVIVDRLENGPSSQGQTGSWNLAGTDSSSMDSMRSDNIMSKYDQTSMHQVNELIAGCKAFSLSQDEG